MARVNITPNAARTAESLRAVGYSSYSAIADIVDNSLDAQADKIAIAVVKEGDKVKISVMDNGVGMDAATLTEALKLGSDIEKHSGDLGKYGMGLVTASWAISKRLSVTTKSNGKALTGTLDIDEIDRTNEWVADIDDASATDDRMLDQFTGNGTGTIIVLSKCDRLHTEDTNALARKMISDFGQIYRHYIAAGKSIVVNGKKVEEIDPLELTNNPDVSLMLDETESTKYGDISIKVVTMPYKSSYENQALKYNIPNQGFYIVRNQREIAAGETLGLFTKHNDFNRLRAEISFSDDMDEVMGVNFAKQEVKPAQAITDVIDRLVRPHLVIIRREAKREKAADASQKTDHTGSEKVISSKSKLLQAPKLRGVRHAETRTKKEGTQPTRKGGEHVKLTETQPGNRPAPVKIGEVDLGEHGDLYEADMEGRRVVVNWNIMHPFYQQMVRQFRTNKDIVQPLDFMLYSLGTAELMAENEENEELLGQIKSTLSSNLRTLMR
jgi:hypothetical protein